MRVSVRDKVSRGVLASVMVLFTWSCGTSADQHSAPDLVLYNGKVVTVDEEFSVVEAVAVRGDEFLAVGTDSEVRGLAGPDTREIDLEGRTVIPGLIDSHNHMSSFSLRMNDIDLSGAETIDDVLAAIAERAEETPESEWLRTNNVWIEGQLEEGRLPTPSELDSVAPDHPVWLQRTGFTVVLNSYAKEMLGVTKDITPPGRGWIVRDESGEPMVFIGVPDEIRRPYSAEKEDFVRSLTAAGKEYVEMGWTTIVEPVPPVEAMRAYQELRDRGELPLRVNMMMSENHTMPSMELLEKLGIYSGFGDDRLRIGVIGQVGPRDGVPGTLLREPYTWMLGGQEDFYGIETIDYPGGWDAFTRAGIEATKKGWRLGINGNGDSALDLTLEIYEQVDEEVSTEGKRHNVIHPFLVHDDQLEKIKELDLVVQMEGHGYFFGPNIKKYWGEDRAEVAIPARKLFDSGVTVGLGTDGYPPNPFVHMWHFVTRKTVSGGVLAEDQALTREQVLRGFTNNGAYLTFEEDIKGSIEEGKLADLLVLSDDLLTVPEEDIKDIKPLLTMVDGEIVYESGW